MGRNASKRRDSKAAHVRPARKKAARLFGQLTQRDLVLGRRANFGGGIKPGKLRVKVKLKKNKLGKGISRRRLGQKLGLPNLKHLKSKMNRKLRQIAEKKLAKKPLASGDMEVDEEASVTSKDLRSERATMLQNAMTQTIPREPTERKDETGTDINDRQKRWYVKELNKVIESSDVLLEVLDARDPMGSRSKTVETKILSKNGANTTERKRIILVLNKIDLVPGHVVESWVKYLRREFPVIAFKASTQEQRRGISSAHIRMKDVTATSRRQAVSKAVGVNTLLQLLKNYCRNHDIKTSISVGVIGYPNVGKSSIINSMKRCRSVGTSSTPGYTTKTQEVKLDSNIKLIDSPGVLFETNDSSSLILRNCIKVESIANPIESVTKILKNCKPSHLQRVYNVPSFRSTEEFLFYIAKKRGKLKKGGSVDIEVAARTVLMDWNTGKIPYYTLAPQAMNPISSEIVSDWGKTLNINALLDANCQEMMEVLGRGDDEELDIAEASGLTYHVGDVKK